VPHAIRVASVGAVTTARRDARTPARAGDGTHGESTAPCGRGGSCRA
jgi:hypothetical protein